MENLKGGIDVQVAFLDGSTETVLARQLPLGEYDAAFAVLEDEIALTAKICAKDKDWAHKLEPESYETLHKAACDANAKGFFPWSARRSESLTKKLNAMRPEILKMAAEKVSQSSPLGLRPK